MRIFKFLGTSIIATGLDFLLYTCLILVLSPTISNLISASAGLIANFILQKNYVFNPSNTIWKSFVLSVIFSIGGLGLGTGLIYILTNFTELQTFPVVAKICTTGVIFFYNYFTKKIAFGHSETGISSSC